MVRELTSYPSQPAPGLPYNLIPMTTKIIFLGVLTVAASLAAPITYVVTLNGPNESPANASLGIGNGVVTIDSISNLLTVNVNFSGLTGTVTASHIHCCTAVAGTGTAGVTTETPTFGGFPLGVTSGSYSNTYNMTLAASYNPAFITANGGTVASAEAAFFAGIAANKSYLNIHSTVFPGGEIRGFLTPTPEPGTFGLMSAAILGLGFAARRKIRS